MISKISGRIVDNTSFNVRSRMSAERPLVIMTTGSERLQQSRFAITDMIKQMPLRQRHVLDIGIGWDGMSGPATSIELASSINGLGGSLTGIDSQMPFFIVDSGSRYYQDWTSFYALYDRSGQWIFARRIGAYGTPESNDFSPEFIDILASMGRKISLRANVMGVLGLPIEFKWKGLNVKVNPAKQPYEGLRLVKGDMFDPSIFMPAWKDRFSVVRIANVLIPHYLPNEIVAVLRNLKRVVREGGRVLIGYSDSCPFPNVGMRNEESLVYIKDQEGFSLEGFMFSVNIIMGRLGCFESVYPSPVTDILVPLEKWGRAKEWQKLLQMDGRAFFHEYRRLELSLASSMAEYTARYFRGNNIQASNYAGMVLFSYDPVPVEGTMFKGRLMKAVKTGFIDKGIPVSV